MILDVTFEENRLEFDTEFGDVVVLTVPVPGGDWVAYDGDYIVTPKTDGQTLETANKVMLNDVTIKAIPYFETSNTSGGSTVYIGTEVV